MNQYFKLLKFGLFLLLIACNSNGSNNQTENNNSENKAKKTMMKTLPNDPHSFAKPNDAAVKHLDLDIEVDFENKQISGTASYEIENKTKTNEIILDTKGLDIQEVTLDSGEETTFKLGETPENEEFMGEALSIAIKPETKKVNIKYATSSEAEALQWLSAQQTTDKKLPFMFTQSQAILARTWIPCQDGPGVRFTYNAKVKVPKEMLAVMSAENPTERNESGVYTFKMEQAIPSYLMALAVGDIVFKSVGNCSGVYAEPSVLEKAAYEFADMEQMIEDAEKLYGPYVWDRYDLIVLPASFPFGGMENPRLTFATPTILAGDRSLVALVAHELAHSWSGNLVTNVTWDDFWLNEGFTVYFEQRIMEALYGRERSEMLALLSFNGLEEEVVEISENLKKPEDTHLKLHLHGRNPDDGLTAIAYDKGYLFLRMLEENYGREKFDAFLKNYFQEHAFQVMSTEAFVKYLDENLLSSDSTLKEKVAIDKWIYGPGLPDNCPIITSNKFRTVEDLVEKWTNGETATKDLKISEWTYQEQKHFIRNLPNNLSQKQITDLDANYNLTASGNYEVLAEWLEFSIKNNYAATDERVESFLINVGRRKFLTPLYKALIQADPSKKRAKDIYKKARPNYHAVATNTMDDLLDW